MKTKTTAMAPLAALLLMVGAGVAHGAATGDAEVTIRSVPLHYTAESLATEEGREALMERIQSAARHACGYRNVKDLEASRRWKACYEDAVTGAVNRVGSERLAMVRD